MNISMFAKTALWIAGFATVVGCTQKKLAYTKLTTKATRQDLNQTVTVAGKLKAVRSSAIVAAYSGYVRKVFITVGQKVKRGDQIISVSSNLEDASGYYPMRSPIDGVVTQVTVHEGDHVIQSATDDQALVRVEDLSKFRLEIDVPELDLPKLTLGQPATVRLASTPGKTFKGEVEVISLSPNIKRDIHWGDDTQSRYSISISLKETLPEFKSGLSAIVDIETAAKKNVLALPGIYLTDHDGSEAVKLTDGSYKKIKVGLRTDESFEILDGLKGTEQVIVDDLGANLQNAR